MLLIPLVLGSAAAGRLAPALPAIWAAVLLGFFARYASVPAATRILGGRSVPPAVLRRRILWTALYMGTSLGCLVLAVAMVSPAARPVTILAALVCGVLAAVHVGLSLAGVDRTLPGEIFGMVSLASPAPLLMVSAGRPLDGAAFGVAALALSYSFSSLSFVRAYRARSSPARGGGRGRAQLLCILVHVLLAAGLAMLSWAGWLPASALPAFLPVAARTVWGLLTPPPNIRALGLREVGVAIAFTLLASISLLLHVH